jgi:2-hydroxychromene-2-carboxylate isomerase
MQAQKEVEFFFDLGSPYSYLAASQLSLFEKKNNVAVVWRPILLGGLFKNVENKSPFYVESANKKRYLLSDLQAWASMYDIPFTLPAQFPRNTLVAMRGALVAAKQGLLQDYAKRMFHAYFVSDLNISDAAVISEVVMTVGMDVTAFSLAVDSADIKKELLEATREAGDRGAFGVPTFFFNDKMFFGNDRFGLLEHTLSSNT